MVADRMLAFQAYTHEKAEILVDFKENDTQTKKTKEINKEVVKKRKELWRIHKCTFWKETNKAWNEKK